MASNLKERPRKNESPERLIKRFIKNVKRWVLFKRSETANNLFQSRNAKELPNEKQKETITRKRTSYREKKRFIMSLSNV